MLFFGIELDVCVWVLVNEVVDFMMYWVFEIGVGIGCNVLVLVWCGYLVDVVEMILKFVDIICFDVE